MAEDTPPYDGSTHIETTRKPETLHNFGPASSRDEIVYTSERPGGDPQDGRISKAAVEDWIQFMKSKGIQHVMVLLDDNELEIYEAPGLLQLYADHNLQVHRNPMGVEGSAKNAETILKQVQAANEKVVAHCTHGMGRSGRVAAGWLALNYGLSPQQATREAIETAQKYGMERMGDAQLLEKWLNKG